MDMLVRTYQPGDEIALWNLFFNTIRTVNIRDYTGEQVEAWAPEDMDAARWRSRIEGINPFVCLHDGIIIGYAGLLDSGYIDHFYVHHLWQGKGVGRRLFMAIESKAAQQRLHELTADVSITARPFFESRGFSMIAPQEVTIGKVVLRNFRMARRLHDHEHDHPTGS